MSRISANFGMVTFHSMEARAPWKTQLEWISAHGTEKMRFFSYLCSNQSDFLGTYTSSYISPTCKVSKISVLSVKSYACLKCQKTTLFPCKFRDSFSFFKNREGGTLLSQFLKITETLHKDEICTAEYMPKKSGWFEQFYEKNRIFSVARAEIHSNSVFQEAVASIP